MNSTEQRKIIEHMHSMGCTRREAAVFIDLSRRGASTIQEIANRLNENRVTVHSAAEQLLEKGLLVESRREKRRLLAAQEPESLLRLIARKEQEISLAKYHATLAMDLLKEIPRETTSTPNLRLYHGVNGLRRMLDESLSARTDVMVVTDIETFSGLMGKAQLEEYYRMRHRAGIRSKLIWPACDFARKMAPKLKDFSMDVRLSNQPEGWQVGFFSWDDKLAIKSLAEGAVTCTILQNLGIAEFYRNIIFESLWQDAKRLTTRAGSPF